MPVLIGELGPIKVNALIWTGVVSRSQALDVPARLDASRPGFGPRWISYFDSSVDISDIDATGLLELRDLLRPVISELAAKGPFQTMLVSNSRYNDPLLAMWRTLTATDAAYPSNPKLAPNIVAAAKALGLSDADAEQVRAWIEAQAGRAP
ncbi:MAG TPA: hypothetical protein VKU90_06515 [Caulobacteraceae bacterium]|nr:hypothetical protein [Caulobacteraceae bacterium]